MCMARYAETKIKCIEVASLSPNRLDFRIRLLQSKVRCEGVKVAVGMKQRQTVVDAARGDDRVICAT